MKSKLNKLGLRKGHWVSKENWTYAYKIVRVKNGKAFINVDGKEHGIAYTINKKQGITQFFRINPNKTNKIVHRG